MSYASAFVSTMHSEAMTREALKATYERGIFEAFLDRSGLSIDLATITSGNALMKEPDILCTYLDGTRVGFELGRLTNPTLAQAVNRRKPINGEYVRTRDPSQSIARKKIKKTYGVPFPVELLLYTEQPILTPENVILPAIKPICQMAHKYSRVWFMGETVEVLCERS